SDNLEAVLEAALTLPPDEQRQLAEQLPAVAKPPIRRRQPAEVPAAHSQTPSSEVSTPSIMKLGLLKGGSHGQGEFSQTDRSAGTQDGHPAEFRTWPALLQRWRDY